MEKAPPGFTFSQAAPQESHLATAAAAAMGGSSDSRPMSGDEIDFFDPPKPLQQGATTESIIRILPTWRYKEDESHPFWKTTQVHFLSKVNPETGKRETVCIDCAEATGSQCAAVENRIKFFQKAKELGETPDGGHTPNRDMGRELMGKFRCYFNVLVLSDTSRHSRGGKLVPSVLRASKTIADQVLRMEQHEGPISHWQHGLNLKLVVSKTGPNKFNIKYDVFRSGDRCPIPQEWWGIFDNLVNLDDLIKPIETFEEERLFSEYYPEIFTPTVVPVQAMPALQQAMPALQQPVAPFQQPSQVSGSAPQAFSQPSAVAYDAVTPQPSTTTTPAPGWGATTTTAAPPGFSAAPPPPSNDDDNIPF